MEVRSPWVEIMDDIHILYDIPEYSKPQNSSMQVFKQWAPVLQLPTHSIVSPLGFVSFLFVSFLFFTPRNTMGFNLSSMKLYHNPTYPAGPQFPNLEFLIPFLLTSLVYILWILNHALMY